jgi:hypothetical protein
MNFDGVSPKTSKFNIHFYRNNKGENSFTSTFEEIQNECTMILLMTPYFEINWLFVDVEFIILSLYMAIICCLYCI